MVTQSDLCWHIITGSLEIDELLQRNVIRLYKSNPRHQLFLMMKYPNDILYQGQWGTEILHYDRIGDIYLGRTGKVYATQTRANEISKWIMNQMFEP